MSTRLPVAGSLPHGKAGKAARAATLRSSLDYRLLEPRMVFDGAAPHTEAHGQAAAEPGAGGAVAGAAAEAAGQPHGLPAAADHGGQGRPAGSDAGQPAAADAHQDKAPTPLAEAASQGAPGADPEARGAAQGANGALATSLRDSHETHQMQREPMPGERGAREGAAAQASGMDMLAGQRDHAADSGAGSGPVIVFIDAGVADKATLIAGIAPGAIVVELNPNRDGLQQIAETVRGYSNIASIQIISHGDVAEFRLGDATYSNANIAQFSAVLSEIGSSLSRDGDILIYGCKVGSGAGGEALVDTLAVLTGADVAASEDMTGAASLGGDWALEYRTGTIESAVAISQAAQAAWDHLLLPPSITLNSGNLVANPSFETTTNWTSNVGALETGTPSTYGVPSSGFGSRVAEVEGAFNATTISQTITTVVGQTYTYSVLAVTRSGNTADRGILLVNGASVLNFTTGSTWQTYSVTFTATSTSTTIGIQSNGSSGGLSSPTDGSGLIVDNVQVVPTNYAAAYTEGGTPVAIADAASQINDPDSTNMASATIVLTNEQAGDRFRIGGATGTILSNGSTGTINGLTYRVVDNGTSITITLTGSATKAVYADTIETIHFESTSVNPSTTPRTITVKVNDGAEDSNVATTTINVTAINSLPNVDLDGPTTPASANGVTNGGFENAGTGWTSAQAGGASGPLTYTTAANSPLTTGPFGASTGSGVQIFTDTDGAIGTGQVLLQNTTAITLTRGLQYNFSFDARMLSTAQPAAANFSWVIMDAANNVVMVIPGTYTTGGTGASGATTLAVNTWQQFQSSFVSELATGTYRIGLTWDTSTTNGDARDVQIDRVYLGPEATGWTATYTENGTPVGISDIDAAVLDADGAIASATIVITNGFAGDVLSATGLPAGITASYNAATFTLTLTGNATPADYAAAIAAVRFSSTSDNPSTTARTINVTVNDGTVNSNTAVATINVIAVNDAPVNTLPGSFPMSEDGTLPLTGLSVADPDAGGGTMTVTLSVASGSLTATTGGGVNVVGSGTGTLTLTGTLANINAFLAGASRPSYTPVADFNGTVQLTMTTSDGGNSGTGGTLTDSDTSTITITAVADITNDTATTNEDVAVTINVDANDSFENAGHAITAINGTAIVVGGSVTVANGSVRLNADGTLTFTPTANYNGLASFTYTVSSGGVTETATVNVTVNAVNDAPVNTLPGTFTIGEDGTLPLTGLSIADVDAGSGTMTVTLSVASGSLAATTGGGVNVAGSGTGTLTLTGTLANINTFLAGASRPTYTPVADFNGTVQLTMTTSDGGNSGTGGTLTDSDTSTITVTAVADIANDTATTNEDTPVTINVDANDSFENPGHVITAINGTAIAVNGSVAVTGGSVRLNADGTLTFTPALNSSGSVSFTYTVTSGGVTETATVNVTVNAVNDAPVNTLPGTFTIGEDGTLPLTGLSIADVDAGGGTMTVTLSVASGALTATTGGGVNVAGSGTGTLTLTGTLANINTFLAGASRPVYTPVADFYGTVQLTMTTSDGGNSGAGGTQTDSDTSTITVTPVVDIADDAASTNEDTAVTINVNANDSFENPGHVITAINGTAIAVGGSVTVANGSVTLNADGTLTFAPATNYNGAASFTYTVSSGGATETATVNVTVNAVNDAPVNTLPGTFTIGEDGTLPLAGLSVADPDAGGGTMTVTLSVASGALTATTGGGVNVLGSGTGTLTLTGTLANINTFLAGASRPNYVPVADFNGTVQLTMTTSDGGNSGAGGTLTDTDFSTITITPVVDIADDTASTNEDTAVTINVNANDSFENPGHLITAINGAAITAGNSVAVTGGSVTLNADGTLTFTPTLNSNGSVSFTYTVTSGGVTETATVNVTVNAVNDAPVNTLPATFTTGEDGTLSLTGLSVADPDAGGGTMTVTLSVASGALTATTGGGVNVVGSGTGTLTLTGTLTAINTFLAGASRPNFVPVADFNGTVQLTMTTSDGGNTGSGGVLTDSDTSTITVTPVVDIADDTASTNEDVAVTINVNANDSFENAGHLITAINGTAIAVNGSVAVTGGSVRLNANGTLTFTPTANYNGPVSFTYTVSSGGVTETAAVNVTVNAVNDAPTQTLPGAQSTSEDVSRPIAGVTVGDVDGDRLTTTLTVTGGAATVTAGGGATISGNGTATVTISGTAAEINAALAGLTYVPTADFNGAGSIAIATSDGTLTASGTVSVAVSAVVDITNDVVATNEDTPLTFAPLANDTFENPGRTITAINGGAIAAGSTVAVTNGSVTLNADGTLTFTPAPGYNGPVSFTYTVTSGGVTETATVSVTVNSVNDAPAGADRTITTNEDTTYTFSAADFGFSDANDNPANTFSAVVITTLPTGGTLYLSGTAVTAGQVISAANIGNLTWVPALNSNGTGLASFTFQVRDNGGTANGGVDTDPTPNTITFNVTPVNDAPVNTAPASYQTNEDTPKVLNGISVADVDANGGTITVTLSVNTGGVLQASSGGGVTVTGSGTASITLSGTLADINTYLAGSSAPVFSPTADFNGPVVLTIVSNDGGNTGSGGPLTDTDTRTITVTAVNDPPVGSDGSLTTAEDTVFNGRLPVATDVDGQALTYGAGGTAPAHGTVTINPDGTYTYRPAANYNGADSFTYTVTDGIATVEYRITVTVTPVNDAPVATPITTSTAEDTPLVVGAAGGVLSHASDVDGDPLSVASFTVSGTTYTAGQTATGAWGSLTLNADGSYTYQPAANFNGTVPQVTYVVSDGTATASSTLDITVTPVNDPPVSTPIPAQVSDDSQTIAPFDISGRFSDPDTGDTLTFSASGLPTGLTMNAAGVISGRLDHSASQGAPGGVYSVTVTATDAGGLSTTRTFTWTVRNPAPVAHDDAVATTENAAVSGSVFADNGSGADSDPDGDTIRVSAVGGATGGVGTAVAGSGGGTFVINADGSYTFQPGTDFDNLAAGATRTTSITYTISDGEGGTATATVTVTVTGENDPPVAVNDTFTTAEDMPATFDVRTNDRDVDGGTLTVVAINGTAISIGQTVAVANGTVTLGADGRLTFTPTANFNGPLSFTYTLSDGTATAVATVNGTVTPVNDAPVARNDAIATTENASATGSVLADNGSGADSDVDGDTLTVSAVNGSAAGVGTGVRGTAGGTFTIDPNGNFSFVPGADFDDLAAGATRTTSVTYTISDGAGGFATATVTVTVTGENDAPVAVDDGFTTAEDTSVTFDVRVNDRDVDGNALTVTAINGTAITVGTPLAVSGGTVTLGADGRLTFAPTANFNGPLVFTYTVSDGITTAEATVRGTVTPVNDAPVAVNDTFSTPEDTAIIIDVRSNDSDIDNDPLTVTQINGANIAVNGSIAVAGGVVTLLADGTLRFTPTANFNGTLAFDYTVSDGTATATARVNGTVTPVNDPPVAVNDSFTTAEDTPVTFDVRTNDSDIDGDGLTVTAIDGQAISVGVSVNVTGGVVTLLADGRLQFTPTANYNGSPVFTYTVSDGTAIATAEVRGTVTPVNDAPVASDGSLTTAEDTLFSGRLPAATDVDNDTVTYAAGTTAPAHGTVTINADGTYTYMPAADYNGPDTFSFIVSDGHGGSNEYYVSVTVTPVNDAPTATPIPDRTRADGALENFSISGYFSDVEGTPLTFSAGATLPPGLTIDAATGVISGRLTADASQGGTGGVYTVTITASDGSLSVTQTFTFTVTNPPPVAVNDAVTTAEDTPVTFDVRSNDRDGGPAGEADNDALSVTAINGTAITIGSSVAVTGGRVTLNADGTLTFSPSADYNGAPSFTYTLSDGQGGTANAVVNLTITPVNDAPVAGTIGDREGKDGTTASLAAGAFFTDVDDATLTYSATGLPPGLTIDPATGLISGTIAPGASGPTGLTAYTVRITATDSHNASATATFTYTIVNQVPVANDDFATTAEDTPVDIPILANDNDPDGDPAVVIRVNNVILTVGGATVSTANGTVELVIVNGVEMLRFTPNLNYNGQESFTYTIDDGNSGVDTALVTITVTPVNDAPVGKPIPDQDRQDSQAFTYDLSDSFSDPDRETLSYQVTGLPAGLTVDAAGVVRGTIDRNASQGGPNGDGVYTVTVTARDAGGLSATQTFQIRVTNPAPVAHDDAVTTNEDVPTSFNVLTGANTTGGLGGPGADIDPDGDTLQLIGATAGNGTVTFAADGTITYTPNPNFNGTDVISYRISDGNGGFSTAQVIVTVVAVNDPPVASQIADKIDSDGEAGVSLDVKPFFTDADHDPLTYAISGLPTFLSYDPATGIVSLNTADGKVPPNASQTGPRGDGVYTVTVTASDGHGGTVSQTFTWSFTNPPPTAHDDVGTVSEDGPPITGNILLNDSDPDGDPIRVIRAGGVDITAGSTVTLTGSTGGTFTIASDGTYTFDPAGAFDDLQAGKTRVTTIMYLVRDANGANSDTATLTITVTGANDAPIVDPVPGQPAGTLPPQHGTDGATVSYGVAEFFSDVDDATLTYAVVGSLPPGLSFDPATGTVSGRLTADASQGGTGGVYTLTFRATDARGLSVTATQTFTVTNPPPVAGNDTASTDEDTPVTINVLGNDSDGAPDSDTLTVVSASAANGTVVINADGTLTYTPNLNYNGTDTITYRISDGQGGFATAIVTVDVAVVNDPPATTPIPDATRHDGDVINLDISGNFIDPEGDPLTYTVTGLPPGLTYNASTGVISGRLAADASQRGPGLNGVYEITVIASDGKTGGESQPVRFTYTILNVVPVANADTATTPEDQPVLIDVLGNDTDDDGDPAVILSVDGTALTVGASVDIANGRVTLVDDNGRHKLLFTPNANYNGVVSFKYTMGDTNGGTSEATVNVTVTPVNDPPVAGTIPNHAQSDGTTVDLGIAGSFSDIDGDRLTFTISGLPPGLAYDADTGRITGRLTADASQGGTGGVYTVVVTASDGKPGSTPATASFTFTVTNQPPVAANDTVVTAEDTEVVFDVRDNDRDGGSGGEADSDALTVTMIDGQAVTTGVGVLLASGAGTVTRGADGRLTFMPATNFNGTVSFSYTISDGQGGVATAEVNLTVTPVADPPTIDLNANTQGTGHTATFTEGGAPVPVADASVAAADPENDIVSLDVALGTAADGAAEVIHLNGGTDIIRGTAASGTVTFGGVTFAFTYDGASALHFQNAAGAGVPMPPAAIDALIQSLRYENRSDNPTAGDRRLAFTVTDSTGAAATAVSVITVVPVNDAPVAVADTATTTENTAIAGPVPGVLGNDSDAEGDSLAVSAVGGLAGNVGVAVAGSTGGSFVINADGSYSFDPGTAFDTLKAGEHRVTSVTYEVSDGKGGFATATLSVTVTGLNDPPVGSDTTISTNEDTAFNGRLPQATDVDGDALTYAAGSPPTHGSVTINTDGTYVYTPVANYAGTDSFTYTVSDGTVTVTYTVTVTVVPMPDAPVAGPLPNQALTDGQGGVAIGVAHAFSDPDAGDSLTFGATGLPTGLTMAADGTISGTVDRSASQVGGGSYQVVVTATDTTGLTVTQTFTITVTNPGPTAVDDAATTGENTPVTGSVLGNDSDPDGDPLQVVSVSGSAGGVGAVVAGSAGGAFRINADGSYSFDPGTAFDDLAAGATRTTSVTYAISDGQGGTASATLTITVTGVNDAPIAGNNSHTTPEDTAVSGTITARDPEGAPLTFSLDAQPAHGTVVLAADGTYTYQPAADFNGIDTFQVTVSDGAGGTTTVTVTVTVTPVNDNPVAVADGATTDQNTPIPVSGASVLANDSDVDGDPLVVSAVAGGGVGVATAGSAGGSFVINADGTYSFDPGAAFRDLRPGEQRVTSVTYTVSDGKGGTATATLSVTVTGLNDGPVAVGDTATTPAGTVVTGVVTSNDSDADGDVLTVVGVGVGTPADGVGSPVAGSAGGSFVIQSDGSYSFTPDASFASLRPGENRVTSADYRISDGRGGFAVATVSVTVTGINDAPTAGTLPPRSGSDGQPVSYNPASVFSDVDGDVLTYGASGLPLGLTMDPTTGLISGTLASNASQGGSGGAYTVSVTATDPGGLSVTRTFTWTVANPPPVAGNDAVTTAEDTPVGGSVAGNDSDPDGDPLTYTLVTGPTKGSITFNTDGTYSYQPAPNVSGTDTFVYQVSDGQGGTAQATVTITITPVNDPPVAVDDPNSFTIPEEGSVTIRPLANDSDVEGDPLTITAIDGQAISVGQTVAVTGGTVTLNGDGSLTFTAATDYSGMPSFTYTISDGAATAMATVSGTVTPVNDAPVNTLPASLSGTEDVDLPITGLSIFDSDAGNAPVRVTLSVPVGTLTTVAGAGITFLSGGPGSSGGTVVFEGTVAAINAYLAATPPVYTPVADSHASVVLTMTTDDLGSTGDGGPKSDTDTMTLVFAAVNDPPTASAVPPSLTTAEDATASGAIVAEDVDGDTLTYTLTTPPTHGSISLNPDGTYVYRPNPDYHGPDSFSVTVSDGNGGTLVLNVPVTVTPVNDAPVGSDTAITLAEDTVSSGSLPLATDIDGDALTYGLGTDASHGTATVNPNGTYSYRPNPDFTGTDSFTYTVNDGTVTVTYTVTVTVTPENDPPVARDDAATTAEDTPVIINVLGNDSDIDGDSLMVVSADAGNGTVTINADGTITYRPDANFNGTDTITYHISDGHGGTAIASVVVTVTPVNDPPAGSDGAVTVAEDTVATGTLPVATDVDGDPLTYDIGSQASNGTVTVNPDGSYSYRPNPDFTGTDSFTYTVSDGTVTVTYTMTVTVTPVNDPPVARDDVAATREDTPVVINVLGNDSDVEGDPLTVVSASALNGTVTINADGTITYQPRPDFSGTDTITYQVSDGQGGFATASVVVTVAPVNDAPVASDAAVTVAEDTTLTGRLPPATDPDGDPVTYGLGTPAGHGTVVVNPDGTYSYRPNPDYFGTDSFTFTVSDGTTTSTYTVTVSVTPVNDAPVARDDSAVVPQNGTVVVPALANDRDVDGDPLIIVGASAGHGSVVVNADGTISYVASPGYLGEDIVTYTVSDGRGGFATAQIRISVVPVDTHVRPGPGQGTDRVLPPATAATVPAFATEAFILDALDGLADLKGVATSLAADGIILSAANGLAGLDGLAGRPLVIGDVGEKSDLSRPSELERYLAPIPRSPAEGLPEPVHGFVLRVPIADGLGERGPQSGQILVETTLQGRVLGLHLAARAMPADVRIVDYRVLQSDGRPLPGWLGRSARDMLAGAVPPGTHEVSLKVVAILSTGGTVERDIRIDLQTGEVNEARAATPASRPPLFQENFVPPSALPDADLDALGEALRP